MVPLITPIRFTPTIQSKSSYDISSKSPVTVTPALLTSMFTRPNCSATAAAHSATAGRSATSTTSLRSSRTPAAFSRSTDSARLASFQSEMASRAPWRAACRASSRPMPEPAPVITTTLLSSDLFPDGGHATRSFGSVAA